jgi:hypothetical protein
MMIDQSKEYKERNKHSSPRLLRAHTLRVARVLLVSFLKLCIDIIGTSSLLTATGISIKNFDWN